MWPLLTSRHQLYLSMCSCRSCCCSTCFGASSFWHTRLWLSCAHTIYVRETEEEARIARRRRQYAFADDRAAVNVRVGRCRFGGSTVCVCVWCVCIRFLCIYVHSLHIKNTHTHTHIYGLIVRVLAFEVLNHVCGIMMRANVRVCVAGCHYYSYTGRCHTIILKTIRKPRRTQNQPKGFRHMKGSGAHIYASSSGHTHRIERERE